MALNARADVKYTQVDAKASSDLENGFKVTKTI